jgi:hypothetical protein
MYCCTLFFLVSEYEESLSGSKFDSNNEVDNFALLHVSVNGDSDDDNDIIQDFVWENMENYKGQRKNFTGSVKSQGTAKQVIHTTAEEKDIYAQQFLHGCKLSN